MKIVLIGNQNSGKTTIFNKLTGLNKKIGNWSGVTVDYCEGKIKNTNHILIDLPGIYSLSPYSIDEEVTVNYLFNNKIDLIVNVIDINYLNRSLYLTTQLIALGYKMVIVFTMNDNNHIIINKNKLEQILGISVINLEQVKNNNLNFSKKNYASLKKISIQERYNYIDKICKEVIIKNNKNIYLDVDNILLNKYLAIPIFVLVMCLIYYLSFNIVGNYTQKYINYSLDIINDKLLYLLKILNVSSILIDLIINGIMKGICSIISFFPQLSMIFIFLNIIKQTGYITRISLLFDKFFSKLGLSGKSLISFILGTSCSVAGILSSRIMEDDIKREKTIFLVPFIPCGAKMLVIIMIYNSFFEEYKFFPVLIYALSLFLIITISFILNKIYKPSKLDYYIMELPKYKLPRLSILMKDIIKDIIEFIKKVWSTILISSIIIWILMNFSLKLKYIINIDDSILSSIGYKLSFLFFPFLGINNWKVNVSIIQGLIAKEQIVTSINILLSTFNTNINKSTWLSFLIFNLFSIPCINTLVILKQEYNSIKKLMIIIIYYFIIGFVSATIIYWVGNLIW